MSARFEVVRTDAGQPWHARLVAANGKIILSSENYGRRRDALSAIVTAFDAAGVAMNRPPTPDESRGRYIGRPLCADYDVAFEIRDVDERAAKRCPVCGHRPHATGLCEADEQPACNCGEDDERVTA